MADLFVQEEDGTSYLELEEGGGFLILEEQTSPPDELMDVRSVIVQP